MPAALHHVLVAAAREFNAGRYFEAHEILEDGLDDAPDALWELMVGLIQIAIGYHKLSQQLWVGGRRMLERGLAKVEPFVGGDPGVNLSNLRARVRADIEALRRRAFDAEAFARRPPRLQPSARR